MNTDNKYFETGSNPYYLNLNNTAKDYSINDTTNPHCGVLEMLTKFIIVEEKVKIIQALAKQKIFNDENDER